MVFFADCMIEGFVHQELIDEAHSVEQEKRLTAQMLHSIISIMENSFTERTLQEAQAFVTPLSTTAEVSSTVCASHKKTFARLNEDPKSAQKEHHANEDRFGPTAQLIHVRESLPPRSCSPMLLLDSLPDEVHEHVVLLSCSGASSHSRNILRLKALSHHWKAIVENSSASLLRLRCRLNREAQFKSVHAVPYETYESLCRWLDMTESQLLHEIVVCDCLWSSSARTPYCHSIIDFHTCRRRNRAIDILCEKTTDVLAGFLRAHPILLTDGGCPNLHGFSLIDYIYKKHRRHFSVFSGLHMSPVI